MLLNPSKTYRASRRRKIGTFGVHRSRSSFALFPVCLSECNETRPSQPSTCSFKFYFSVLCPDPHTLSRFPFDFASWWICSRQPCIDPLLFCIFASLAKPSQQQWRTQYSMLVNAMWSVSGISTSFYSAPTFPPPLTSNISSKVETLPRRTGLDHSFWSAYIRSSLGYGRECILEKSAHNGRYGER